MTFLSAVLVAALNASGLIGSPTQINQRDGINLDRLSKSALDGLSEEDRNLRWGEHERVGREFADLLGFEFGKPLADYGFALDAKQPDDPAFPVYNLAKPAVGFVRFRPIMVLDRLCGVLLERPMVPGKNEKERQKTFALADFTVRTNLASVVGLSTNDLAVATNGVPHVWRISLERWNTTQVLRIGDGELVSRLVRAAKAEAEAAEAERVKRLMHHDESVPKEAE